MNRALLNGSENGTVRIRQSVLFEEIFEMSNNLEVKKLKLENGETLAYMEAGNGNNILLLVRSKACGSRVRPEAKAKGSG